MCCQEVDTRTSSHIEAHPKILIALNAVPSPEEDRVEYVCWFVRVEEDMQAIYVDTGGPLGVQLPRRLTEKVPQESVTSKPNNSS